MDRRPTNPYFVLLAALIPGAGHVLLGQPQRGLRFLFYMAILGWVSVKLMPADATFIGRHIGGIFIYGLSILDAYKTARLNMALWEKDRKNAFLP
jgi:hypothetical protein